MEKQFMNAKKKGNLYIGTSGFSYPHWGSGLFYPTILSPSEWLKYYSSFFNTVELNVTFNKLPHKDFFILWEKEVPENFKFSVKGNQYITHLKKLTAISEPLKLFMERIGKIKKKLASIVWEIPPLEGSTFKKIEGFISHLKKYSQTKHIFNFEQISQEKEIYQLIEESGMFILEKGNFEKRSKIFKNSSLRYLRLEAPTLNFEKPFYSQDFLKGLSKKIDELISDSTDLFVYFANETEGYAVQNAKELLKLIKK